MKFDSALEAARELNSNGTFRELWYYYPAYHDGAESPHQGEFFVMRRLKKAEICVAIFADGMISKRES